MKDVKELVKDPEWQKVRLSLLRQWKENPNWCCLQLRKYLDSVSSANDNKLKIVMNYLTGSGFRSGRIKHSCISKLRSEIMAETKKRKFKK